MSIPKLEADSWSVNIKGKTWRKPHSYTAKSVEAYKKYIKVWLIEFWADICNDQPQFTVMSEQREFNKFMKELDEK